MGTPPFRADHVGSLLRPDKLKAARDRREGDHHTRVSESRRFDELREIEDEAIVEAIALQESVGLRTVTDGEFRRRSWWQDFVLELDGTYIDFAEFAVEFTDPQGNRLPAPVAHVDGKIRRSRPINRDSFLFLKNRSRGVVKVTMPSPPIVHFFGGRLPSTIRYPISTNSGPISPGPTGRRSPIWPKPDAATSTHECFCPVCDPSSGFSCRHGADPAPCSNPMCG